MCHTSEKRSCRRSSFSARRAGRVFKNRPLRKGNHSIGHQQDCECQKQNILAACGSRVLPNRRAPLGNHSGETGATENVQVASAENAAEKKMQRGYAERREEFERTAEMKNMERGVCGHGCLSRGQKDHSACNRKKVCSHYERGCLLKAKCCGKYYPCRKCHDEVEDHAMNRFETELLACKTCGMEDIPFGESCPNCHVRFGKYSCRVCKFFDDSKDAKVYHCSKCGICRVGAGLGIDNVHCEKCDTCVPIEVADTHKCTANALKRDCPICLQDMATSSEQVLFMNCGHAMHMSCFSEYTRTSFTCPICIKALADMTSWYRALDVTISKEQMPPAFANRMRIVYCNDCEVKSKARFHFKYHKCGVCRGYNTTVVCEAKDEKQVAAVVPNATGEANSFLPVDSAVQVSSQ